MISKFGSLISTVAATLSASCCILPMVLLALGFTSLGPFALLMRYRPLTLTFSFVMLAFAFYLVYRPRHRPTVPEGSARRKRYAGNAGWSGSRRG
jgi:hypothetical protein